MGRSAPTSQMVSKSQTTSTEINGSSQTLKLTLKSHIYITSIIITQVNFKLILESFQRQTIIHSDFCRLSFIIGLLHYFLLFLIGQLSFWPSSLTISNYLLKCKVRLSSHLMFELIAPG